MIGHDLDTAPAPKLAMKNVQVGNQWNCGGEFSEWTYKAKSSKMGMVTKTIGDSVPTSTYPDLCDALRHIVAS